MTVTLEITKCVYGGDGLARLGDGRVCFVSGARPGETVKAEIREEKRAFVRAHLKEVLTASPDRLAPGPVVPGMVYADVTPAAELAYKQDQLENFLWKAFRQVVPLEVHDAPSSLNYRNKAVYHLERRGGTWRIGYRTEPSHEVVDVERDPLAVEAINAKLPEIRAIVRMVLTQGAKRVRDSAREADDLTVRWTPIDGVKWWLGDVRHPVCGDVDAASELHEKTCGQIFLVPPDGFYQVNPAMAEQLVKTVVAAYAAGAATAPHVVDLYCGVGVFGLRCLAAAPEGARLVGVESGRLAVAAAKRNAAAAGRTASFFCERVGGNLGRIRVGAQTTVIVDPPRGGLERGVAAWLAASRAPRVLYVSCDPATLTRDLQTLAPAFDVKQVHLFNLFPRTARFETFVELQRKPKPQGQTT